MRALALCFALLALLASGLAFSMTAPHTQAPAHLAPPASTIKMTFDFDDVALGNEKIMDDPNAQPARKCASCFG